MDRENREVTALVKADANLPVATKKTVGYWLRVANGYKTAFSVLCFVLAVFLVIFTVLSARSFAYDSLFYFGKDVANLISLANDDDRVIYYDYKGESARPAAYRGGVAVAHAAGVDIYAASGELLLAVEESRDCAMPRISVSRDYLAFYDFGGNSFCVCNSYTKLYEGQTEHPIYGAFVSDAGYVSLITGSDPSPAADAPFYLSEVLVYDANFNLVQHFGRATATVSAAISENGRTVTLVGADASGTVVDVYTVGDEDPLSTTRLSGFPLAAGYTASNKLAVLTDTACYTLSTAGKLYDTVSYEGASLAAYSIDEKGIALALEVDRLLTSYRVLVLDKKGNIKSDAQSPHRVSSIALSDDHVWLLGGNEISCFARRGEVSFKSREVSEGALGIAALDDRTARVMFPAQALDLQATE